MPITRICLGLLPLVVLLAGCWPQLPQQRRMLGIIDYFNDGTTGVITAPATVRAGEDVEVTITTFAGACDRAGDTDIAIDGMTATITVYDIVEFGGCVDSLHRLPHTATLRFEQPGVAVILVQGRRKGLETSDEGTPRTIEQQIVVE